MIPILNRNWHKISIILLISMFSIFMCVNSYGASTVALGWNLNAPAQSITSYKVYKVKPKNGPTPATWVVVGTSPNGSYTVSNLIPGSLNIFAVSGVSVFGESGKSDSVIWRVPLNRPIFKRR